MTRASRYFWNILIAIDQLLNTVFGGDPDETISSRVGKCRDRHGGTLPWYLKWLVFLEYLDPGHLTKTQEQDQGKDEVWKLR